MPVLQGTLDNANVAQAIQICFHATITLQHDTIIIYKLRMYLHHITDVAFEVANGAVKQTKPIRRT